MRTVIGFVAVGLCLSLAGALSGCGPACDSKTVCSVEGQAGDDTGVCDGSDFVQCDEAHRGNVIFCGDQPRKAVCGSTGWSFEYAALAQ